jgi:simple sugar transport system permease protein
MTSEWFVFFAFVLASALALATPLLLAALGEMAGERAGVLNIGLEGMMLMGAWAGAALAWKSGSPWLGLAGGMLAGSLGAALFGAAVLWLRADAIVAGTGLNLLAAGLTGTFHRAMQKSVGSYTPPTLDARFFYIAGAVLVPLLWWALWRTRSGLRWRACGEHPASARGAGVNVLWVRWVATLGCGALCGAGGAFLSLSHTNSFAENMVAGRGFLALAIVIFGRWSPWGALWAALGLGAAQSLGWVFQSRIGTSYYPLLLALPSVLTLLALALSPRARR